MNSISVDNDRYQCSGCTDLCALVTGRGTRPPVDVMCIKGTDKLMKWRKV